VAKPLFLISSPILFEGVNTKGESKRGEASLIEQILPPLSREGDKEGGLPNKNFKEVRVVIIN